MKGHAQATQPLSTHPLSPNGPRVLRRANTRNYAVSFSIKGHGQVRKTLSTTDLKSAQQLALKLWYGALHDFENGRLHQQVTFSDVAKSYLAKLERQVGQGQKSAVHLKDRTYLADRYFLPFFGERKIGSITSKTMADYLDWRTEYWFNADAQRRPLTLPDGSRASTQRRMKPARPKPTTLVRESVQLNHFFKHGIELGHISAVPSCELPPAKLNPKPGFSVKEVLQLRQVSEARCCEDGLHRRVQNDRIKLHSYVMFALHSGMRVTEMTNLRWSHVDIAELPEPTVTIYAHGKGKTRDFVPSSAVIPYLTILRELFAQEVGRSPVGTDPVFAAASGEPIGSFRKGLDALLEASDLLFDNKGKKRSAGSFRHFYITEMKRAGVETDLLSLNVGTSPRMIQQNYSKVRAVEERAKLDIDLLN